MTIITLVHYLQTTVAEAPFLTVIIGALLFAQYKNIVNSSKVQHIPSIGKYKRTGLLSYLDTFRFLINSGDFIKNGLAETQAQVVKIPGILGWTILVRGRDFLEELRKAPESILSAEKAVENLLQTRFTVGEETVHNPYHDPIIRGPMRRAIPELTPALHEEVALAFDEYLNGPVNEWKAHTAMGLCLKVMTRTSNRLLVGNPLCRNPDFIELAMGYTMDVMKTAIILRVVPSFLRPLLSRLLPTMRNSTKKGEDHIAPIVKYREEQLALLGDDYERPNDMLAWLMEEAKGEEKTARALTKRILLLNLAAIHTTNMTVVLALYELASCPQYQQPLRDEITQAIKEHGWTKEALDKMVKLDSFIKESQRLRPLGSIVVQRYVKEDYILNGVTIPAGSTICADLRGTQVDPDAYSNPHEFQPWRFCDLQEKTGKKIDITTISQEFLTFGFGNRACPGRFFASTKLKLMLSYLVLHFDVKCEVDGVRPKQVWFGINAVPDPKAKILFRRRE